MLHYDPKSSSNTALYLYKWRAKMQKSTPTGSSPGSSFPYSATVNIHFWILTIHSSPIILIYFAFWVCCGSWVCPAFTVVFRGSWVCHGSWVLDFYNFIHTPMEKKNNGSEKTTKAWLLGFGRWSGSPECRTKKKREMRREKKKKKKFK